MSKSSQNFLKDYSSVYDVFYKNKDYPAEVEFLQQAMKENGSQNPETILSLGCGTGTYEILLAKNGYSLTGVDMSEAMLELGRQKIQDQGVSHKIAFVHQDIRQPLKDIKADFAMAMFNIVGYQTENGDLVKVLENVHKTLPEKGLFVFDAWYMPAVLKDPPTDRVKEFEVNGKRLIRMTKSKLNSEKNVIEITFHVLEIEGDKITKETVEAHPMRYWSLPELEHYLSMTGFKLIKATKFMDLDIPASDKYWDMFVITQKV